MINTIPKVMPIGYKMYLRYGFVENGRNGEYPIRPFYPIPIFLLHE